MQSLRKKLEGPAGKAIAGGAVVVGIGVLLWSLFGGGPTAADISRGRTFIDAESGKTFQATVDVGMSMPLKSPFTGKNTGVEPELCYWTADGKPKTTPDYVLLNRAAIPPKPGPTFCPICHRLVVGRNPSPMPDVPPPPTESEYSASRRH